MVQWLRLPKDERRAADSLAPELVPFLDKRTAKRYEVGMIAGVLATLRPGTLTVGR